MIAEGDKVVCKNIWRWTDKEIGKRMAFHGSVGILARVARAV
jgi:hypothetical protein